MRSLLAVLFCLTALFCQAQTAKLPYVESHELKLQFKTDKSPIAYKVGEDINITVSLDYGKQKDPMPEFYLQWTCNSDSGQQDAGMGKIAPDKPLTVKTKLDRPGFVRFVGILIDQYGRKFAHIVGNDRVEQRLDCSVGADVDKILPANVEPADFRAFWKKQRELLDTIPVKPVMKKMDETKFIPKQHAGKFDVWEVTVPCAGPRPVTGHLIMRKDAKAKSLPVQVSFDGYGPGAQGAPPAAGWFYVVAADKILFKINAHGYELGQSNDYYKKFFAARPNYAFNAKENDKPETSYFYGMALRVMRAFDFVKTLPQWDGKNLIAQGGSQGGLQATWAGSLVPELTECRPHVTWCCDINGTSIGRMGGWRPDYRPGLAYYDAVFHTRSIPKTCLLNIDRIGLGDYVCPPSGLAAQYNAATCPKKAVWVQNSTHMSVPPNVERFPVSAPASDKEPPRGIPDEMRSKLGRSVDEEIPPCSFDPEAWTLTVNGKTEKIKFSGRENFKTLKQLPVMTKLVLEGILNLKDNGCVYLGVGADWWWELFVDGEPVYGRIRSMPGGNGKDTFEKTDWIVPVPLDEGCHRISLKVTLGENGTVAFGSYIPGHQNTLEQKDFDLYRMYRQKYPFPEVKTKYSHKLFNPDCIVFETAQAYPAAVEVLRKGEKKWQSFRCGNFDTDHSVKLPFALKKGDSVRIAQHVFLGGWEIFRTEPEIVE